MRNREQPRTIGVGRHSARRIKSRLQQSRTHLKPRCVARDCGNTAGKRSPEVFFLTTRGGNGFLQNFPSQWNSVALAFLEHADEPLFFRRQVFFWINPPVHSEPASLRHDIEVRSSAALPAYHQYGVTAPRSSLFATIF